MSALSFSCIVFASSIKGKSSSSEEVSLCFQLFLMFFTDSSLHELSTSLSPELEFTGDAYVTLHAFYPFYALVSPIHLVELVASVLHKPL